jgi:hypothetical protein
VTPVTPVAPGIDLPVTVYGRGQPKYRELPAFRYDDGAVVTRWKLTLSERFRVLFSGNIWLTQLTFNRALQPVKLETECPIDDE